MATGIREILNSRYGVNLAVNLGRWLPPGVGFPLAKFVADCIVRFKGSQVVRSVRLNQWIAHEKSLTAKQLDHVVQETLRNTAFCQFDLYHNLHSAEAMLRRIHFSPLVEEIFTSTFEVDTIPKNKKGFVLVGVHMSNFDLVLHAAARFGLQAQALSVTLPGEGYQIQTDLRQIGGLFVTPVSTASLRQALQRLESGGSVITGIDFPAPGVKYRPQFFGHPAALPVHHIFLASKTNTPVYVFAAILGEDNLYHVDVVGPIYMHKKQDQSKELIANAERVLEVAEEYIRQDPAQWSMFYPIWPQEMDNIP